MSWRLVPGDCVTAMRGLADESVDSVVTDPPYELGFMGKKWDASGIAYSVDLWREVLRVLKPGGHLLAFGGTRTYHRMACAIEDAGFEVRDSLHWMYGTGFPKSLDVSKAIDDAAGAERIETGRTLTPYKVDAAAKRGTSLQGSVNGDFSKQTDENGYRYTVHTAPATDAAKQWDGWGTALKPGHEPIVLARKPLEGTVAQNVQKWGTGGLNIDGCRLGERDRTDYGLATAKRTHGAVYGAPSESADFDASKGRWPANVLLDEDAAAELDAQSGTLKSGGQTLRPSKAVKADGWGHKAVERENFHPGDSGGASRFFFVAKPDRTERDFGESRNIHPTVKPVELMQHLVRLVTPPGGLCLDPFTGSGSTGVACQLEGFEFLGCELQPEYLALAESRISQAKRAAAVTGSAERAAKLDPRQSSLFEEAAQ